jgi:hypothetical protein
MPKRSDYPYPEVGCPEIHYANTFERYKAIAPERKKPKAVIIGEDLLEDHTSASPRH